MTKVNVYVTLRESVVDPQGIAAKEALQTMGYKEVENVRIGKLIELELDGSADRNRCTCQRNVRKAFRQ